jgi:tRNA nucleotidyltransferase (CCA-adding enzyme)
MKMYLVGGAVRDALMQTPSAEPAPTAHADRDWVVVGATPQALQARGFLPVGRDFPVFLHPHTREEYALARTERKTAPGYHGFAFHAEPSVTLEDDLARRDLTINAMAVAEADAHNPASAHIIDPHGGQRDLRARVLRHVTASFAEDPVRILRLARFAARFPDFSVAPETLALMRQMVDHGEVDHLVPERVWQELARGLMEQRPSRMLAVLRDCGALVRLLPEVDRLWGVAQRADYHPEIDTGIHLMMVLDMSARLQAPLPVRFACLGHDLGKGNTPAHVLPRHLGHEERSAQLLRGLCERWRVPRECRELADVVAREHGNIHRSNEFGAAALLRLLERCDALRRPERFDELLLACESDARGRLGFDDTPYPQRQRLRRALQAALAVNTGAIAAHVLQRAEAAHTAATAHPAAEPTATASAASSATSQGLRIASAIHAARARAVAQALGLAHEPATA